MVQMTVLGMQMVYIAALMENFSSFFGLKVSMLLFSITEQISCIYTTR